MSFRCRPFTLAALAAVVLAIAACGSDDTGASGTGTSGSASKLEPVTIAFNPVSSMVAFKLADERGLFKKRGIEIKYGTPSPTGASQIAQILSEDITVGAGAYTSVIAAVANGLPVTVISALDADYEVDGKTAYAVVVPGDSDIGSFKDLEGKTVAVNSLQGNWDVSLREAIANDGGDPSKVKLVAVSFADQVTAVKSGRVDAVSTAQPFIAQLLAQDYKSIGNPQAIGFGGKTDSVVDVMMMSKKYVDEHPDVVKNFVAAMEESNEWANSRPEELKKAIARITKTPIEVVNDTPLPVYTTKLGPTQAEEWSKLLVKYGIIQEAPPVEQVQWSGAPL